MERTALVLQDNGYGEIALYSDDKKVGKMDISVKQQNQLLIAFHTEVDDAYAGRGFAKILLKAMVDYARDHQLKVRPLCPFVLAQFKRHPEAYGDLWVKPAE